MNSQQTRDAVTSLHDMLTKVIKADTEQRKAAKAKFGGKITEADDAEEAVKNAALQAALMIVGGIAVNIARIADALDGQQDLMSKPRERL